MRSLRSCLLRLRAIADAPGDRADGHRHRRNDGDILSAAMMDRERLVSLFSFENEEFIFPSVHHAFRFTFSLLRGQEPQPRVFRSSFPNQSAE